jgi:hypothetical protein
MNQQYKLGAPIVEQWSKWQLFAMMIGREYVSISGVAGVINKIEVEDGGGHCFIITMSSNEKVFVRSID